MPTSRNTLETALSGHGLRLLGGWIPTPHDTLPAMPDAATAAVVWMVGQVGSECWQAFSGSRFYADGLPDPLDRWSKFIGDDLARQRGGVAIYPSDGPPYAPFQQWAGRAEPLFTSPLMLQIHPNYGLWHAYRFALVVPTLDPLDAASVTRGPVVSADPCLSCDGRPCLSACPVDAFTPAAYDVAACASHLHGDAGQDCVLSGCLARRACPVGVVYRYEQPHAAFHMAAFTANHRGDDAGLS
jgi:hypothetical protein